MLVGCTEERQEWTLKQGQRDSPLGLVCRRLMMGFRDCGDAEKRIQKGLDSSTEVGMKEEVFMNLYLKTVLVPIHTNFVISNPVCFCPPEHPANSFQP